MFRLISTGSTRGDCTAPYRVMFDHVYTIREFIDEVLKKEEWGYIGIDDSDKQDYHIFGHPKCEYRRARLLYELPEEWLDKHIESCRADGGWSRMDYLIKVKEG